MLENTILDVVIGLIFIYLLLSLLCSAIHEWMAGILALRSRMLAKSIKALLYDETGTNLAKEIYEHGLIDALSKKSQPPDKPLKGRKGPSYIPPCIFASALIDKLGLILSANPQQEQHKKVEEQLMQLEKAALHEKLNQTLTTFIKEANGDAVMLHKKIESWFDDVMDRISGWYKRQSQIILLIIGSIVTVSINADTIYIAETLVRYPPLRASIVEQSKSLAGEKLPDVNADFIKDIGKLSLPLGWHQSDKDSIMVNRSCNRFVTNPASTQFVQPKPLPAQAVQPYLPNKNSFMVRCFGWILTGTAVSMGAPFWFDLMNKFLRIRSTGISPAEKKKEQA